ncbi:hypothetical protein mgb1_007 [Bacillus phage MG-B1]|uniref:Uncharacterized protein n=1 Tax=Bacillus phage MG-B1 TaxID=1309583 RepID=M4WNH7_9CAUD|nr:hypothetical protein mgb1_007 [Bacillus phage MG-B1]AGI10596.1 hypothetical protein mgb1_007 [Bacillus phage MG-B1]
MIQTKTLDFTGKISGSITQNPNIAKMNGVEFTQTQYNLIFGSELSVASTDELTFEFPVPNDVKVGLQFVQIYFKSKVVSGEVELRSSDKGVYNDDTVIYKQKFVQISPSEIENDVIKFNIKSTDDYGVYEVKCDCIYDDDGLNSYSGNYTYLNSSSISTTVTITSKKLADIMTELESLPVDSLTYTTFAQVPSHDDV